MCACSQYFYAMFSGNLAEAKANRITLQEIDPSALVLLIDFVYTTEIQVTEENVQTLLPAANILEMSEVGNECCNFLNSQLHPSNALGIKAFADIHSCSDLFTNANTYCKQHFTELIQYEEYLSLPVESVCKLICSDLLTVTSEEQVFEAVLSWVNHDRSSRQEVISQLMEHVRLPLMSQEYLVQRVELEPLMKTNSHCKDFLFEEMKFHLLKGEKKALFQTPRTIQRISKVMLVIGGQGNGQVFSSVECFDFKAGRWLQQLAEMPSKRHGCVIMYDPSKDLWIRCPEMKEPRALLGVAVLNDIIYAVGGVKDHQALKSAECFDVRTREWRRINNMITRRCSVGVGVLNGYVYAVGGDDESHLSSVERYNPVDDVWTTVAEMSCRRFGPGVGVIDGVLYVVGGNDGIPTIKSVEMYNPETNIWTPLADMHSCRAHAGVISHRGLLYVVGGWDGKEYLSSVEYYDPKENVWTLLSSSMISCRGFVGVTVIDRPSH